MSQYEVKATYDQERTYDALAGPFEIRVDFNETAFPGSAQYFLTSLAACKLVALMELRQKHKMDITQAEILVKGETGRGETLPGTRIPSSRFLKIDILFRVKTPHTEEELRQYLKQVNSACTVGNSISEKIEQNYSFEWI